MGLALYRKNRPRSLAEVVGQEPITQTLANALKHGQIAHAYLLSGPRGVGKTSVARILAHAVNDLPYNDESIHLDIIEIDAASNRRIDEIRDIREKVHIAPTTAKYKVYIIDEVHMLTKEAFNALLKTLEEPPAHVIFILATTEPHKLPDTIISRTQRFNFKPIDAAKAADYLAKLAKVEKIDIEPAALKLLAEHGNGSFRDSISLLDQLSASKTKITESDLRQLMGLPPAQSIGLLLEQVAAGQVKAVLDSLTQLQASAVSPNAIAAQLSRAIRQQLVNLELNQQPWAPQLMRELLEVSSSKQPAASLEIALLEAALNNTQADTVILNQQTPEKDKPIEASLKTEPKKAAATNSSAFDLNHWPEVINTLKTKAGSLYTALRLAEPSIDENGLVLSFQFPLHMKKVSEAANLSLIAMTIEEVSGQPVLVTCQLSTTKSAPTAKTPKTEVPDKKEDTELKTISNIFGSAEVLES